MKNHQRTASRIVVAGFLLLGPAFVILAAAQQPQPSIAPSTPKGSPVNVGGKTLFTIQEGYFAFTAEARAQAVENRITRLAKRSASRIAALRTFDEETTTAIADGDEVIMTVTDQDAKAAGRNRQELAKEDAQKIRTAAEALRKTYSFETLAFAALWTLLATLALIVLLKIIALLFRKLTANVKTWHGKYIRSIRIQKLELLPAERIISLFLILAKLFRLTLVLLLLYSYVSLTFSFFPWTRGYTDVLLGYVLYPLRTVGGAFLSFVPNLFFIAVILLVSYYLIKLVRFAFSEIEKENITFTGFYRDWARPTYKIVRFLIIAFTLVIIFPYLPGSRSPAFQGVSIFFGLLLSLGSSSAVSNVVAGTVLTYTRAFQVGDRVKIGDAEGDVIEKTLLVTRVRTIKNVDISIPNSMVLSSHIVNYSAGELDHRLILHTGVTIGYDAPWRTVHKLLIEAAVSTQNILQEPQPFVLQTSLDDFYVSYQLNAFTDKPAIMAQTYSMLHQNIQDKFNAAGVEIMSPHYNALRDGNSAALPLDSLGSRYSPPAFRVNLEHRVDEPKAREES